jgi:hypothetical protein
MDRYTFRMKMFAWLLVFGALGGVAWSIRRWRRQLAEREQASEQRFASFMAQVKPGSAPLAPALAAGALAPAAPLAPIAPVAPQERLLLEAAGKAGEAGEPVLAIQLYAKLLSRYPQTSFAAQARAAVSEQKKKLPRA